MLLYDTPLICLGSKDEMLPEMALESCDFENEGFCGFTLSPQSDFNWTRTNR